MDVSGGSEFYIMFFIIWYFFSVMLCLNVMIAFIIDYLSSKWEDGSESADTQNSHRKQSNDQKIDEDDEGETTEEIVKQLKQNQNNSK